MTIAELVELLSAAWEVGIVVTDSDLDQGPRVLFANPAFCRLTGYSLCELKGGTPRILQGPNTKAITLKRLSQRIRKGERFLGELVNYRKSGEAYICQLDIRPVRDRDGNIQNFIAFEREVYRPRGRPVAGESRFRPIEEMPDISFALDTVPVPFAPINKG
jgi:PAS domain S-box-containing protein